MKDLMTLLKGLTFLTLYVVFFLLLIKTLWFPLLCVILMVSFVIGKLL